MVEGFVQDAVETTSGDIWYRAQDANDRIYYVKQGEGIIGYGTDSRAQKRYAAASGHSLSASVADRGMSVEDAIDDVESLQGRRTVPTTRDNQGTLRRALGREKNRMLGYIYAKYDIERGDTEAWNNAIEDYSEFRDEVKDAESSQERQQIREAYGIGGS